MAELLSTLDTEERLLAERMEETAAEVDPEVRDLLRRQRAHGRETSHALRNRLRLLMVEDPLRALSMRWALHAPSLARSWALAIAQLDKATDDPSPLLALLPAAEESERLTLESWGREYYAAQRRFCEELQRDLELVDMRWARRWETPLRALLERLETWLTAQHPDEERSL